MYTEVVIVCGYGCCLTSEIKEYLQCVAYHLDGAPRALVIVSGGRTNERTAPGACEAEMMGAFLRDTLGVVRPIAREGNAVTTLENLRFSREYVRLSQLVGKLSASPKITIFCDSIRAFKVRYLARRIFGGRGNRSGAFSVRVIGCDFRRSFRDKLYQFLVATPAEILSYYLPSLERWMREQRLALNRNR